MNDVHRTEICCFTSTGKKIIRYYSLCAVTIEAVLLHNLREEVAWVLVEYFRAGIPAGTTAHACRSFNYHIHGEIS
jgi:hypothetical protein